MNKGKIKKADVFRKFCTTEHLMRKFNGFGISEYILKNLDKYNIKIIQIVYQKKNESKVYLASLKQFQESEKKHTFEKDDHQRFVSIKEMIEC